MIIVRIVGGLGNQMFQYAAGRSVALMSGQQLKLDLTEMKTYGLRDFALNQFAIDAQIAEPEDVPPLRKENLVNRVSAKLGVGRRRMPRVVETNFAFEPKILSIRGPAHLSGYWQSEKYFEPVSDEIRRDFALSEPFAANRLKVLELIQSTQNPISVHVRRGDYVSNPKANAVHGTCEPEWYGEAFRHMLNRYSEPKFFVFSDDPAWARANLPSVGSMIFVEPQSDQKDAEDMHLMASCKAHIIANSTFSWWGAWLNPKKDKHVIAPAQWFRSQTHDARDLIPRAWQRLSIQPS